MARSIIVLEHYYKGGLEVVIHSRQVQSKIRDLNGNAYSSGSRDALKFYSKRTTCSCLKAMHQEARRIPKMGLCYGCTEKKERMTLSVCSRCMVAQYCSRECQVAHWPYHEKGECDILVSAHKRQQQMRRINVTSAEDT